MPKMEVNRQTLAYRNNQITKLKEDVAALHKENEDLWGNVCLMMDHEEEREKLEEELATLNLKSKLQLAAGDPSSLVGKRFLHLCRNAPRERPQWFPGTVLQVGKDHHLPLKTAYLVQYDDDPDGETQCFPLLVDLGKGEVIIN
ncbi:hypothetical protein CAPTEDRAFT_201709 [Capitella teleta]|uniref:Uncharacterized protein n=1 Tax=Capitella teleta TaxID=283909 RepID=R7TXL7_CAPTE|nr:hypothetical protein CAPTEDRAFT_201709 [Capitella teleta]|eukprot:ELT95715.1 hypothetical protein CAPTEDRAFT_201709 [Capitella teleta]